MEFITTGNQIAVENFSIGKIYTIVWATGNYKSLACVGKGSDFVMFQDQAPDLLFCLTMDSAITVSSIDEGGGGSGTNNYNELENKPSINGIVLVGNKTGADLNLVSQADLDDYATNASVVAGLATKQDALSSSQLAAVNSGITSALVTQIGTNTSAIAGKQDALSSSQLAAVNSGITSTLVTQIGTNTSAIAGKQDALSSSQLAAVNSGITSADVAQITTNKNNILMFEQMNSTKNKLNFLGATDKATNCTATNKTSKFVELSTNNIWAFYSYSITPPVGEYVAMITVENFSTTSETDSRFSVYKTDAATGGTGTTAYFHTNGTYISKFTADGATTYYMTIYLNPTGTASDISLKATNIMVIPKSVYDAGFTDYQPYAMTNAEITAWILAHS